MSDDTHIQIFVRATVPRALVLALVQVLRLFDRSHPDCVIEIAADAPTMSLREAVELAKRTGLPLVEVWKGDKSGGPH